jgi:hypothetical protein
MLTFKIKNTTTKTLNNNLISYSLKRLHGFYFTMGKNTNEITKSSSVSVYQAPEWQEINNLLNVQKYFSIVPKNESDIEKMNQVWEDTVMNSSFKKKYFSLLPFCVEDRQTQQAKKKFVLNMELLPETKYMKIQCSMISGKILT